MRGKKLLIDTNIIIGLEDHKEIDRKFSSLLQECQANNIEIWVHEISRRDIERDKDINRQKIILSKIHKFPELKGIPIPERIILEQHYGKINNDNDYVDVVLLHTLYVHDGNAVDFLVTEDSGLHKRANALGIGNRVFRVEDALVWLSDKYDRASISLPFIEEKGCHQIPEDDDIFLSLRDDYDGFRNWFNRICVRTHRECWTINFSDEIAAIAIRKDELHSELLNTMPSVKNYFQRAPEKLLKICTFKIKDKYRGEKFGEQLLKQILWWGYKNNYELIYLTIFPRHESLIELLMRYGFEVIGQSSEGEKYLAKSFTEGILKTPSSINPLDYHRQYYPAFLCTESIRKFLIPIKPQYYAALFPENAPRHYPDLFPELAFGSSNKITGNTIRKVYICSSQIKKITPGDILLFYNSRDNFFSNSQKLTTIGVVDGVIRTDKNEDVLLHAGKRSVFSTDELQKFTKTGTKQAIVINFLLTAHIVPPVSYTTMQELGIKGPYQGIRELGHAQFESLYLGMTLNVKKA
jgi:hypothetical protein